MLGDNVEGIFWRFRSIDYDRDNKMRRNRQVVLLDESKVFDSKLSTIREQRHFEFRLISSKMYDKWQIAMLVNKITIHLRHCWPVSKCPLSACQSSGEHNETRRFEWVSSYYQFPKWLKISSDSLERFAITASCQVTNLKLAKFIGLQIGKARTVLRQQTDNCASHW